MIVNELGNDINFVINTSVDLAMVAGMLEMEIPLYALGGALLSVAASAEQIRVRALEAYATCAAMRGDAEVAAGLPDEKTVRYIRSLLVSGRSPGPEVGADPETEAGRWS